MLRWPRPAGHPGEDAGHLLSACERHLAADGSAIVAANCQPGTGYAEHEQVLRPAAQAAGLRHLHDIVPLPATDGRGCFNYPTTSVTTPSGHDSHADATRPASTTRVVFGHPAGNHDASRTPRLRTRRPASGKSSCSVTRDTTPGCRDRDLSRDDGDDRPAMTVIESRYVAAPAAVPSLRAGWRQPSDRAHSNHRTVRKAGPVSTSGQLNEEIDTPD